MGFWAEGLDSLREVIEGSIQGDTRSSDCMPHVEVSQN